MAKFTLLAAVCRATAALGAIGIGSAAITVPAYAQETVAELSAAIQQAVIRAQNEASAAGLSADDAAAAVEAAVQAVIAASGASPTTAALALESARTALSLSGQLNGAGSAGLANVQAIVGGTAATPASGGGSSGGGVGGPTGGTGGGGGSDYRPTT